MKNGKRLGKIIVIVRLLFVTWVAMLLFGCSIHGPSAVYDFSLLEDDTRSEQTAIKYAHIVMRIQGYKVNDYHFARVHNYMERVDINKDVTVESPVTEEQMRSRKISGVYMFIYFEEKSIKIEYYEGH